MSKYSAEYKREVLQWIYEHLEGVINSEDDDTVDIEFETLLHGYLEPLSSEDYFGTEGWEVYFD